jgi:WD40 repeat protein
MKHEKSVRGAEFSWDSQRILSWSGDDTVRLWQASSGAPVGLPMKHEKSASGVWGAVFNWDGQRILSWSDDGTVRLWQASNGAPIGQPMKHEKSVLGAEFSWDGQRILSWSDDGTARLWSVTNGALIALFPHGAPVTSVRLDPQEQRVLTSGKDGVLRLWDISFHPEIPLEERILEFEVRSATTLANNGTVRVLSGAELAAKRQKLADLRSKQKSKP